MAHGKLDPAALIKLHASASVALPLVEDPVAVLAGSLSVPRSVMADALLEMQESGALLGAYGEANPKLEEASESHCLYDEEPPARMPDGAVRRWWGPTSEGHFLASYINLGRPSDGSSHMEHWYKVGIPYPRTGLLESGNDRTFIAYEQDLRVPPMRRPAALFAGRMMVPAPFDPNADFWEQLAGETGLRGEEALASAKYLVLHRVWRRFALRFDWSKLGVRGCGLAYWEFDNPKLIGSAAEALTGFAGTGDVSTRIATASNPANLAALFVGRAPGEGEAAAQRIASSWNRPLHSYIDLELH